MPPRNQSRHIYNDAFVTIDRVHAFAMASIDEQQKVLALLRTRAPEEHGAMHTLVSLVVATLLVILGPSITFTARPDLVEQPLAMLVAAFALSAVVGAMFIVAFIPLARDAKRKGRAMVWLGAYEDEIARTHRLRGRAARRWRRSH